MASYNLPHPPVIPQISKHGVLCLWGFGLRLQMQNGHLYAQWGIGEDRYSVSLPRVHRNLKRVVIVGSDGIATFASMRWIADIGASLIFLDRRGKLLFVSAPTASSDVRLRRAQSLALGNGTALRISRELISQKLDGQAVLVRDMLHSSAAADAILQRKADLAEADSIEGVRIIEAQAAKMYWGQWADVPIRWPRKDERRIPANWKRFGSRISPITHSPRLAANPPNACMNLINALCESECRIALIAMGLDPDIGLLHVDAPNRSSLANDLQEILRPRVDSFVLNWVQTEVFRKTDFWEDRNGNCRIATSLATKLCETSQVWYRLVARGAEYIAQELSSSIRKPAPYTRAIATRLTQSTKRAVKGSNLPAVTMPKHEHSCGGCGKTIRTGRTHCGHCAIESATQRLTNAASTGRVVAHTAAARAKQSATRRRQAHACSTWNSATQPAWLTQDFFARKVQPLLASISTSKIAGTIGVSRWYAGRIREGYRPHPRHWQALAKLVGL
jgi:CRISPR-associated endonuclease Cas1